MIEPRSVSFSNKCVHCTVNIFYRRFPSCDCSPTRCSADIISLSSSETRNIVTCLIGVLIGMYRTCLPFLSSRENQTKSASRFHSVKSFSLLFFSFDQHSNWPRQSVRSTFRSLEIQNTSIIRWRLNFAFRMRFGRNRGLTVRVRVRLERSNFFSIFFTPRDSTVIRFFQC